MFMMIVLVVLLLALVGGGLGHRRYGYAGWSPLGILLVVAIVLLFTGNLHI
jgi:hypothetical protein